MGSALSTSERINLDTIPKRLQFWSETRPERELFVFHRAGVEGRLAYSSRRLLELAGKFAARLRRDYGFQKGDVIVNTLPNSPERVLIDVGITLAGCVCMNGSIFFSDGTDFLLAARNSGTVAVVVCPEDNFPAWRLLKQYVTGDTSYPKVTLKTDRAPSMTSALLVSRLPNIHREAFLRDLEETKQEVFVEANICHDDVMYVFTTSGTTGYSKLVAKTHQEIIHTWSDVQDRTGQQSRFEWHEATCYNDRTVGWMGGFPFGTYVNADTRVLLDVFDTRGLKSGADMWRIIQEENIDYGIIMPLDMDDILKHATSIGGAFHKIKIIGAGGQPITKNQFESYYTISEEIVALYGSTEAGFFSFGILHGQNVKDYFAGYLKPGIEVRVVDDQGRDCRHGQLGTIHVRGKGVFSGYLNVVENPDPKTLAVFTKDGWLDMQDSGYFDEEGNLYVLGRMKDVIIFGSTIIYPGWLESRATRCPGVSQVCVVPVSDPVLYHNICAVLKPAPGAELNEQQLRAFFEGMFLQDKDLEGIPVPKYYMILDDFPTTSTGKMDRICLQKMAEKKFGFR